MPANSNYPIRSVSPATPDEVGPNKKDKGYRRYASNVERALSLFDATLQEWADYISFLGRLLKALQTKPSGIVEIPHKTLIAVRLAQCLEPQLPSGVHQKALEVYAYVFSVLGTEGLSNDLTLYLPGFSSTLSFGSLSVKPFVLQLFETYISPLHPAMLRSALKDIELALLPGLEEETSEEYERTYNLLNKFRDSVRHGPAKGGEQSFWQSIFLASITSPSRRQGALAYLIRALPRMGTNETLGLMGESANAPKELGLTKQLSPDIEAVISPEPGLLLRCFATGLQDEQYLIQRGFLDLLVTHLPLHSAILHQRAVSEDLELLVAAASSVVARREMSLNRRLWVWFLGPGASDESNHNTIDSPMSPAFKATTNPPKRRSLSTVEYFELYGLEPLVHSIRQSFMNEHSTPSEKTRPFRICLSLMDRWEIGGLVVPQIFLLAMESIWQYQKTGPPQEALAEILRSASVFFNGIESSLIWAELIQILLRAFNIGYYDSEGFDISQSIDQLKLILFIVSKFNIREEEMLTLHIPMAILVLLIALRRRLGSALKYLDEHTLEILQIGFQISVQLLELVPDRIFASQQTMRPRPADSERPSDRALRDIQQFYSQVQQNSQNIVSPIQNEHIRQLLLHNAIQIVVRTGYMEKGISFLEKLNRKGPCFDGYDQDLFMSGILKSSKDAVLAGESSSFRAIVALVSALEMITNAAPFPAWSSDRRARIIIPNLIKSLWVYMSPSKLRHNVEAVRCLWRIRAISPDTQLIEGCVATMMFQDMQSAGDHKIDVEGARRFAILWAHSNFSTGLTPESIGRSKRKSGAKPDHANKEAFAVGRPLLLLLDTLADSDTEVFLFTVSWLQSLPTIQTITTFLADCLRATPFLVSRKSRLSWTNESDAIDGTIDLEECLYYLQTISNLIQYCPKTIWHSLASHMSFLDIENNQDESIIDAATIKAPHDNGTPRTEIRLYLVQVCLDVLAERNENWMSTPHKIAALRRTSVLLLHKIFQGPASVTVMEIDSVEPLIQTLHWSVERSDNLLQKPLIDLIMVLLKERADQGEASVTPRRRATSLETLRSTSRQSLSTERNDKAQPLKGLAIPPPGLIECLMFAVGSFNSHPTLEHWVRFIDSCLAIYATSSFQFIMPLVDCFVKSIESVFHIVRDTSEAASIQLPITSDPVATIYTLFNGLEHVLVRGHDQLARKEVHAPPVKSPEQVQGFFGNMVSGVFASEAQKSRSTTANQRLTILLCFKDAVRISFNIWSWGHHGLESSSRGKETMESFKSTSLRLSNRMRRMLENTFTAEPLECTETLVEFWHNEDPAVDKTEISSAVKLLHTLQASRPKNTIPALFNAIYSRTNPEVLDPVRKSTLTSELSDVSLAQFLAAYTKSMEDDALDEIWTDCMTFLRDVLGNPMPHRQTLPLLLEFTVLLGEKIDNTNFGEQRKMRRDIGDLFVRLLAATFTIKPLAFSQDLATSSSDDQNVQSRGNDVDVRKSAAPDDVVAIVARILPSVSKILIDTDRIAAATTTISTQILAPSFRWKSFPRNITISTLDILTVLSKIPEASKFWRRDAADAFNDSKFFHEDSLDIVENGWMPILRQWSLLDKERMSDLLSRLSSPTTAGIVFGVGASSARLDADRKAQLNLRRIAFLILSADNDSFISGLNGVRGKLDDLTTATVASSPSSTTRAEVYMVLRALILKNSPVHLAPFWPIVTSELRAALSSLNSTVAQGVYNPSSVLQAAKLLDTLLTLALEEFQLRTWIFITDNTDAVYRPLNWKPVALVDELSESLDFQAGEIHSAEIALTSTSNGKRTPLLTWNVVKDVAKEDLTDRVLRPFYRQLSILAYESTYRMEAPDRKACCRELLHDLFDASTLV